MILQDLVYRGDWAKLTEHQNPCETGRILTPMIPVFRAEFIYRALQY